MCLPSLRFNLENAPLKDADDCSLRAAAAAGGGVDNLYHVVVVAIVAGRDLGRRDVGVHQNVGHAPSTARAQLRQARLQQPRLA